MTSITLFERLAQARGSLVAAGISSTEAAVDVDVYARTILGWDRARLLTDMREAVPDGLEPLFSQWLERRQEREPTAYITRTREFWGLDFLVTPAVLIPRPETEFIVEEALPCLRGIRRPLVADIGTGSGNIGITIAYEALHARVIASDVSHEALGVARENAERHGVGDRVSLVQTSYLDGLAARFDLIVANPPYVKDGDKPALARDVRHEPEVALFGGSDGLRDITGVLDTAIARLKPLGWLVMEFGFGQEDDVADVVRAKGSALRLDHVRHDLQGLARTAIVQRVQ